MFILSHDRKILMDVKVLKVEKNFGGRGDAKYALIGTSGADNAFPAVLSYYASEEEAIAELKSIFAAIDEGKQTYTVKE